MKNDQRGMLGHIEIALIAVVLVAGGFVGWRILGASNDNEQPTSVASQETASEAEVLPEDTSSLKSIEEIQQLAQTEAGESAISGIELETEDGVTVYVVYLQDGRTLAFNAVSGEAVLWQNDDDNSEREDVLPANWKPGISIQDAIRTAQEQRPGVRVEKVEIEVEDGIVVYSVRFIDDSRIDVNASNGTIQRVKNDDDSDQKDGSRDDDDSIRENVDSDDDNREERSSTDDSDGRSSDDNDDEDDRKQNDDDNDDDEDEDKKDDDSDDDDSNSSNSGRR